MNEILNSNIEKFGIQMKKKGFSEVSSANDSDTDSSGLEQIDEGFSDISSANQGDEDDSNDSASEDTESE